MKKLSLSLVLLFLVSVCSFAQITATTERRDKVTDPGTQMSCKVFLFTSVKGVTETDTIDVTGKKDLILQLYSGTTMSGNICDATMVPFWIGATPMSPASSVAATYTKYTSATVIPISANTSITTCTPTIYQYGLYRMDVSGLSKIKLCNNKAVDAGTTVTAIINTK